MKRSNIITKMKIKFISYGHKFYEEEGKPAPYHDFLFSLRDLKNPYWVPELKDFNGLDKEIIDYFKVDENIQDRLQRIFDLLEKFIIDFKNNSNRPADSCIVVAFKCTGGKHRSVYFAQNLYDLFSNTEHEICKQLDYELEHVDLHRYLAAR